MSVFRRLDRWMARRFPVTRVMARLGIIASVFSGLALALHVGGAGGYALPLSYLLGAPTNMVAMRLVDALHPIPKGALWSGTEWNLYLFLFVACIALNWMLLGFVADLFGERPRARPHARVRHDALSEPTPDGRDRLVREFEELEGRIRNPGQPDDASQHRAA